MTQYVTHLSAPAFSPEEHSIRRFVAGDSSYRMSCQLGDLSVWREGQNERRIFHINLGVLAELTRRVKRREVEFRETLEDGIRPPTPDERREIWLSCARDPELRFHAVPRGHVMSLGGWHRCLFLIEQLCGALGEPIPWRCKEGVEFLVSIKTHRDG